MSDKLNKIPNCPFCNHDRLQVRSVELNDEDYKAVLCLNCSAWGPVAVNEVGAWRLWKQRSERHVFSIYEGTSPIPTCVCGKDEK